MGASLCYRLESGTYGVFAATDEAGYSIENQRSGEKVELTGDWTESIGSIFGPSDDQHFVGEFGKSESGLPLTISGNCVHQWLFTRGTGCCLPIERAGTRFRRPASTESPRFGTIVAEDSAGRTIVRQQRQSDRHGSRILDGPRPTKLVHIRRRETWISRIDLNSLVFQLIGQSHRHHIQRGLG